MKPPKLEKEHSLPTPIINIGLLNFPIQHVHTILEDEKESCHSSHGPAFGEEVDLSNEPKTAVLGKRINNILDVRESSNHS